MTRSVKAPSLRALAVSAAAMLLAAGCANTGTDDGKDAVELEDIPAQTSIEVPDNAATAAGEGDATCPATTTIGYVGAMTGPNAQLGINIYNGVQLAIDQHNEANPKCQVE
ncbi:MAG TPA: branched-chain amino acid ABC transporter substrate-binding protein, partial [Aeromicrobium sp.]|nr:branched-chain amino acid ABC transporter substrate-binding protein [Aeromicrobium sp.]